MTMQMTSILGTRYEVKCPPPLKYTTSSEDDSGEEEEEAKQAPPPRAEEEEEEDEAPPPTYVPFRATAEPEETKEERRARRLLKRQKRAERLAKKEQRRQAKARAHAEALAQAAAAVGADAEDIDEDEEARLQAQDEAELAAMAHQSEDEEDEAKYPHEDEDTPRRPQATGARTGPPVVVRDGVWQRTAGRRLEVARDFDVDYGKVAQRPYLKQQDVEFSADRPSHGTKSFAVRQRGRSGHPLVVGEGVLDNDGLILMVMHGCREPVRDLDPKATAVDWAKVRLKHIVLTCRPSRALSDAVAERIDLRQAFLADHAADLRTYVWVVRPDGGDRLYPISDAGASQIAANETLSAQGANKMEQARLYLREQLQAPADKPLAEVPLARWTGDKTDFGAGYAMPLPLPLALKAVEVDRRAMDKKAGASAKGTKRKALAETEGKAAVVPELLLRHAESYLDKNNTTDGWIVALRRMHAEREAARKATPTLPYMSLAQLLRYTRDSWARGHALPAGTGFADRKRARIDNIAAVLKDWLKTESVDMGRVAEGLYERLELRNFLIYSEAGAALLAKLERELEEEEALAGAANDHADDALMN